MGRRWFTYLAVLLGSIVFYWAYQAWFAWFLLMSVLLLPLIGLLFSLPAMLSVRCSIQCAGVLEPGAKEVPKFSLQCRHPVPPYWGKIQVTRTTTGESWFLKHGQPLPADHCGQLVCAPYKLHVYDYLGLFRLKVPRIQAGSAVVRPAPVTMTAPVDLDRYMARAWRPKPGGGFSENHELRLYRPGDNLNQVHWKLSAKTGKLVIREAMEPQRGLLMVTMDLRGTSDELDQKFGKLLWLGQYLLQQGLRFELHVLTADGVQTEAVSTESSLLAAVDRLLCQAPAESGTVLDRQVEAFWQYHIGGGSDEY